ncbi:MarR family winged helix-turn-helix transcriptional regulator [Niallia nealsonii]|uniref:MarR family transcriptional regulator n=1 Tax=Niallia nealsonii TaxID=115979 RepID=A0A2N0Z7X8_9BACI|nr:MarR family transcriptional regulator [Niallia nealsonii]PKG25583.1 MarR family transcriptional regulator [Niallia nealsonii]
MKDALNNELLRSYANINKAYFQLLKVDAERMGITVVQLKTMYRISAHPNTGLGELAEILRLTKSTVSGVIDRLVHQGLVERTIPSTDRRAVNLKLTDKGQETLKQLFEGKTVVSEKMHKIMNMPKEDINKLLSLNNQILSILTAREDIY